MVAPSCHTHHHCVHPLTSPSTPLPSLSWVSTTNILSHCHCCHLELPPLASPLSSPPWVTATIAPHVAIAVSCQMPPPPSWVSPHCGCHHPLMLPSSPLCSPSHIALNTVANILSHCHHCSSGCCCHCSSGHCCCHLELPSSPSPPLLPFMLPLLSWVGCHCCHLESPPLWLPSPPHVALSHYCLYGCSSLSSLYVIQEICRYVVYCIVK